MLFHQKVPKQSYHNMLHDSMKNPRSSFFTDELSNIIGQWDHRLGNLHSWPNPGHLNKVT